MHKIIERENGQVNIIGNEHFRDIIHGWELTNDEKKEHDYLDFNNENEVHEFVRYRGWAYYLGDFTTTIPSMWGDPPEWMKPYDGFFSEGFCGGVLVNYGNEDDLGVEYGEKIKVYRYY